jgi:hypothetical protein
MKTCRVCGLELPSFARFCARCGSPLPDAVRGTRSAVWVLVLCGIAAPLAAAAAVVYGVIAIDPATPGTGGIDAASVRSLSAAFAIGLLGLAVLHGAAFVGLMREREWGRVAATIACVLWALTCIGLPVGLLALNAIWKRRGELPAS